MSYIANYTTPIVQSGSFYSSFYSTSYPVRTGNTCLTFWPLTAAGESCYQPSLREISTNWNTTNDRWIGNDNTGRKVVRRRVTANKKERRRTQCINHAFAELRECIPNVPSDTKLSKIKTLQLATTYIAHLMDLLNRDSPQNDRKNTEEEESKEAKLDDRRMKTRTGWPQHVWALELKQL